ncbi:DUF1566 domain-containing protein [Geobacter sp. DSM 9736]|uniref:Lcl domain-containing protein n=1 Tax=Geobacter sp. DSM 9736 TaxID=1277350 RepID=UPI000B50D927|nr:DUF1566 domain-containing protein [Geobacter sp. DSM 9736]SNB46048.1 Protein of unknown function [Geobacter sp. DSM 9736]
MLNLRYMLLSLLMLVPAGALAAPAIQLPQTGQTSCYDAANNEVSCADDVFRTRGQDGDIRAGVPAPEPRFRNFTSNGIMSDRMTDLVWTRNADCFGSIPWQQALDNAETIRSGVCDVNDGSLAGQWRLPNRKELLSLAHHEDLPEFSFAEEELNIEWLTTQGFRNVRNNGVFYWTSNTYLGEIDGVTPFTRRWVVHVIGDTRPNDAPTNHALFVRSYNAPVNVNAPAAFTGIPVGEAAPAQVLTIANGGIDPLEVTSITVTGTDNAMFTLNPGDGAAGTCGSLTPTVPAGGNCTMSLAFTPATAGEKAAALVIVSNASNTPTLELPLSGTGVEAEASFTATGSVNGNGTLAANEVVVASGAGASFTVNPAEGFRPGTVGGTCPAGTFDGNVYTTGPLTGDCTVVFSFEQVTTPGGDPQGMADVVRAFRAALGKAELTAEERTRLDVAPVGAPNGSVDSADVVILLRRLVGLL